MQRRRLPNARPQAPTYEVALREVIAVEHPAIIKNLDNALKSFGRNNPFERVSLC
jgi:general transcription factor 3C polypeptide 5 (transcription factor C subunit 1)